MSKAGKYATITLVAVAISPCLAACNSGNTTAAVPNVVGERLDVAEGDVQDAGLDYEEVGGGMFGIVVKSNWTVCSTDPASGSTAGKVRLIVDRTCSDTSSSTAAASVRHRPRSQAASSVAHSRHSWTMPDLRGRNLQSAQDAIQALTHDAIWYTGSHDATGADRHQWLDRDWQVCSQTVAPGRKITPKTRINFGVVRVQTETCP